MKKNLDGAGLKELRTKLRRERIRRLKKVRAVITVHMGTCGTAAGAEEILEILKREIRDRKIPGVWIATAGCAGWCSREPMMTLKTRNLPPVKYGNLDEVRLKLILEKHLMKEQIVDRLALAVGSERMA